MNAIMPFLCMYAHQEGSDIRIILKKEVQYKIFFEFFTRARYL